MSYVTFFFSANFVAVFQRVQYITLAAAEFQFRVSEMSDHGTAQQTETERREAAIKPKLVKATNKLNNIVAYRPTVK